MIETYGIQFRTRDFLLGTTLYNNRNPTLYNRNCDENPFDWDKSDIK